MQEPLLTNRNFTVYFYPLLRFLVVFLLKGSFGRSVGHNAASRTISVSPLMNLTLKAECNLGCLQVHNDVILLSTLC